MLRPIRASQRAISSYPWPRSGRFRRCLAAGLHQQQHTSPSWDDGGKRLFASVPRRWQETAASVATEASAQHVIPPNLEARELAKKLPTSCPGCGAPSQTVDLDAAGFYGRRRVTKATHRDVRQREEDAIFDNVLKSGAFNEELPSTELPTATFKQSPDVPICDRCHYLRHQSRGTSIIHPSMQSIQQIIEESPHKHNHIYHILDAADFPLSLIPNLVTALHLPRLRTQNRRSKSIHYIRGRVAEVSFIITRSDLLAPKKEQVDTLVPYLREVLRDALGRNGRNIRLGNVRCVSAMRGWWTPVVKEDIWNRGGAGWMVGKVNVGKSALYEVVFPKGRNKEEVDVKKVRQREEQSSLESGFAQLENHNSERDAAIEKAVTRQNAAFADSPSELSKSTEGTEAKSSGYEPFQESELNFNGRNDEFDEEDILFDESEDASLLPPAQSETAYPNMPLVSALPGTTASPIRIPFGNGKGELIDLPGVHRSSLDTHIKPEHRKELIMNSRVVPEQHTVKPGQSILIGGVIRITPKTDDLVFLAYPFVPLEPHVTSHDKAVAIQTGVHSNGEVYSGTVDTIATDTAKQSMQCAGTFKLVWDVTKTRAGPLTQRAAGKQKTANLPFIVYSADILIEGVGWIELTCQVRGRRRSFISEPVRDALGEGLGRREVLPEVEVWSPEGKFVGMRRPMNAWVLGGPRKVPNYKRHERGRMSISFQRRKEGGALGGKRAEAVEAG